MAHGRVLLPVHRSAVPLCSIGGLTGAASASLVGRTAIPRVDTDGFNLFALWWICLLFALPKPKQAVWCQIALTVLASGSVALFVAWYSKPGFLIFLGASFAFCLFAQRFSLRRMAFLVAIFVVSSNPLVLRESALQLSKAAELYVTYSLQPQTMNTPDNRAEERSSEWSPLEFTSFNITENRRARLSASLTHILSPPWLAGIGLLVFVGWAVREWRLAAPTLPLVILGFMGLATASRFLMFLAPFVGFGLGVLLSLVAHRTMRRTRFAGYADALACAMALGGFAMMIPGTSYDLRPKGLVPSAVLSSMQRCARELPPNAVVWHSWGFGYLIQDVMGAATYTDGGRPQPVIDHLLVKALTDSDPLTLRQTIAYLDSHPQHEVATAFRGDYQAAYQQLMTEPPEISNPSFILLTPSSMGDFEAYFRRGQWDPGTGRASLSKIRRLFCARSDEHALQCTDRRKRSFRIDLTDGVMQRGDRAGKENGPVFLSRVLFTRQGFVQREHLYPRRSGLVVEAAPAANGVGLDVYMMQGAVFSSNLNQLFALGRSEENTLELVCDEFPEARLYRVLATSSAPDESSQM